MHRLVSIAAALSALATAGEVPECHHPVELRVPWQRVNAAIDAYGAYPDVLWLVLLGEEPDPDLPAELVKVPSRNGPFCRSRLEIAEAALRPESPRETGGSTPARSREAGPSTAATLGQLLSSPVAPALEDSAERRLARLDLELQTRDEMGIDRVPRCAHGPVDLYLDPDRIESLVRLHGEEPERLWEALLADAPQPVPAIRVSVPSPKGAVCRPDRRKLLLEEREALIHELERR